MDILTPDQLVAFYADEDARVNDDVARICAQLTERETGTCRPKNCAYNAFELNLPDGFDAAFVEKVAAKFRAAGWDAKVAGRHDMRGPHSVLELKSSALAALPAAPESHRYACR